MTQTLHRFPDENPFDYTRQVTDLDYIVSSRAALTSLAENDVGFTLNIPRCKHPILIKSLRLITSAK
jgi:hypothetical protein